MACVKIFQILLLFSAFCILNSAKLVYRKYEKKHPKKNYVQVVEIFQTLQVPPHFSANEKELNDFLAKDSYKTDMNCTKTNESESETLRPPITNPVTTTYPPVTRPVVTTLPTIPTTAFRRVSNPTTLRYTSTPNLNNLFTIRMTKPTIKPNPRENQNPDYSNLLPDSKPNVQMTKHPLTTMPPTILIKEMDESLTTLRNVLLEHEREVPPVTTEVLSDEEIIYPEEGEELIDDIDKDYDENNYPDIIPTDEISRTEHSETYYEGEDYDEEGEGDDYDEPNKRRKRRKIKRVAPLPKYTLKN